MDDQTARAILKELCAPMEQQRKRILELENKESYLESLLASANREIVQQQKRIYELEDQLVDAKLELRLKDVQNQV